MIIYQNGTLSSTCVTWSENLVDVKKYTEGGQDLYIRLYGEKKSKSRLIIGLSLGSTATVIVIIIMLLVYIWKKKQKLARATEMDENVIMESQSEENIFGAEDIETPQLPPMDFGTILRATENFSDANEIGHGGFGTVYKGRLPSGQEIAVKKLSAISRQGIVEFKTEVMLIANLQHINLVRLVGWSVHKDERVLVYEYLENGSLQQRLFGGGQNSCELNWQTRFNIIKGIAQGLAYMQQGSRDMIIHRDLKPGNILLDRGMVPKISDFGLARICNRREREANTTKPSGTFGYMSPEYAESGSYSTKSDIFSFGVMLLEIVSGKENRTFSYSLCNTNLLSYMWTKWHDENWEDTVDQTIREYSSSIQKQQVQRCLEVGLLCVQQDAEDRPNMSSVLMMLVNDTAGIPSPKLPGFYKADGGHNDISITSGSSSTAIKYSSSTSHLSY
ncbi:G-type lectin S-receptor-like serine/threonine-protein kinase SRK [Capsella rubella]|nr:G-type lectin S-receptor-like serine/threonine-protein kinase SRK [Capsella rubella]